MLVLLNKFLSQVPEDIWTVLNKHYDNRELDAFEAAETIKQIDRDSLKVMESEIKKIKKALSWGSLANQIVRTEV